MRNDQLRTMRSSSQNAHMCEKIWTGLLVLLSCFTYSKSQQSTCSRGYYRQGNSCVPDPMTRIPGNCTAARMFQCGNGDCIPIRKLHDCVVDCNDGADETCFADQIRCDRCKCVSPAVAASLCRKPFSERICELNETVAAIGLTYSVHRCPNGNCILDEWILDGSNDCGDWSDEDACIHIPFACDVQSSLCVDQRKDGSGSYSCQCRPGFTKGGDNDTFGRCIPLALPATSVPKQQVTTFSTLSSTGTASPTAATTKLSSSNSTAQQVSSTTKFSTVVAGGTTEPQANPTTASNGVTCIIGYNYALCTYVGRCERQILGECRLSLNWFQNGSDIVFDVFALAVPDAGTYVSVGWQVTADVTTFIRIGFSHTGMVVWEDCRDSLKCFAHCTFSLVVNEQGTQMHTALGLLNNFTTTRRTEYEGALSLRIRRPIAPIFGERQQRLPDCAQYSFFESGIFGADGPVYPPTVAGVPWLGGPICVGTNSSATGGILQTTAQTFSPTSSTAVWQNGCKSSSNAAGLIRYQCRFPEACVESAADCAYDVEWFPLCIASDVQFTFTVRAMPGAYTSIGWQTDEIGGAQTTFVRIGFSETGIAAWEDLVSTSGEHTAVALLNNSTTVQLAPSPGSSSGESPLLAISVVRRYSAARAAPPLFTGCQRFLLDENGDFGPEGPVYPPRQEAKPRTLPISCS